ncbi:MAG: hypothetical protein AB2A00_32365, partial [Myxococcota bacterium]
MSQLLAKASGGSAVIVASVLGDALGRVVDGTTAPTARDRVAGVDANVTWMSPPSSENDPMREAHSGTPSAATMRALALVESALLGPDDGEALVVDALRRTCSLAFPWNARTPMGALLGPATPLQGAVRAYAEARPALSCASETADASLLTAAALLGAIKVELPRAALLLRSTTRDPVTLCACMALSDVIRQAVTGKVAAGNLVKMAREAEEKALDVLRGLPGTLS